MTWITFRRDTATQPWAYLGAADTKPTPVDVGEYLLVDLTACGEQVTVAPADEALGGLRTGADAWRAAHGLAPLVPDRAAALEQSFLSQLSQP